MAHTGREATKPLTREFRENFQRSAADAMKNTANRLPDTPTPPERPQINRDLSNATDVCFGSIGPWEPWDGKTLNFNDTFPRAWTCESRDSVVKALGFTSFFLKGSSYVCSMTPLPQAQVAARAFDLASFASTGIALVVSVTKCENTLETKLDALAKACEKMQDMKLNCAGVDNTPF
jgi:hypothetical protein